MDGKRKRGRPRITWRRTFKEDLKFMGRAYATVERVAQDREGWKLFTARWAREHGKALVLSKYFDSYICCSNNCIKM